jgi:hypothetical protein
MYQVDCELKMKCADRIEELETENKNLRYMIIDQIEGTGDDPEIMAASRAEWAARAKAAEAKLAKAVEALEAIVVDDTWGLEHDVYMMCRATLAELRMGYVDEGGYDG